IGTPRTQMAATGAEPPRTQIPATITSAELGEALFGSQASQYGNEATAPSRETIAANKTPPARSETVLASSEPAVPGRPVAGSTEPPTQTEPTTARHARPGSDEPPPATTVGAAAIETLAARAELMNETGASPPAQEAALPSPPTPAVRSKAA